MISIGVDIGTFSIKIAEVHSTSRSYIIRNIHEIPLTLDLTKDKKIEIIDALRTLFGHYDLEKTQFVFALPQKSISMRLLQFPFRERFKVQKAVASQLEDDLPFSQEDAIFETKIVRYHGKGADVLAMAVPKERVSDVLNMSHDCGVAPALVSSESLALGNLFERWSDPPAESPQLVQDVPTPREADLVLNIGHLNSQLMVYANGIMLAARNIDWGGKNLADAIGAKYGMNYIQAIRELQLKGFLLIEKGQGTKEQMAFSQTLEKSVNELIGVMRLIMFELQSELNLQWTKGLMLGGGSQLKNLAAFLTMCFEIPFNRFKQFDVHPSIGFEANAQIESVSGVAVGLALEAFKRPRNPAPNFLKGEFARQSHFFESMWEKWGYSAQLTGMAFLFLVVFAIARESLSQRLLDDSDVVLRMQAESIAGLKGKRASNENIRKFLNNVDKDAKNRKQAEKVTHLNSAMDILNVLSASLPPGSLLPVEIKRVSIDNELAEIHGYTSSAADISRVQIALQKLSTTGKAETIQPRIVVPPGQTPFAFRLHLQRYAGG
jgi:general secretion pathway protein L